MDKKFEFYPVAEVAELLRLSDWSIYEAVRQGSLPCVRVGRIVRIEVQAFNDWVAAGGMNYDAVERQAS